MSMDKAIITGHSRGLGEALAETLLRRGFSVLAIARSGNAALAGRHAGLREVTLDLADTAALARWLADGELARFAQGASRIVLLNNAGQLGPVGAPGQQGAQAIARALAINVAAPIMLSDAFVAATQGCADRRIAHVSSGAGRNAYPGWSIYGAGKAALDLHARAVQLDAVAGLSIASIAPGVIDTGMQAEIRGASVAAFPQRARFEALKANNELASPADAGRSFVDYLLSDHFGRAACTDLRHPPAGQ
ncbi:SDR family oxidoreductase [Janthinobacterium sp. hw3]|uniref:SDR family oxidoreductase n=2 Tax=Janthinobacterium fluminis TaxID=2987524 RepID=A0ABT5JVZ9_9BURK|nr:SDR family oxidoreductase [Janthinobacterium fluminis]MDC8756666.1 SDR family oxidoreductase [Janthinobacterium fluminis]